MNRLCLKLGNRNVEPESGTGILEFGGQNLKFRTNKSKKTAKTTNSSNAR